MIPFEYCIEKIDQPVTSEFLNNYGAKGWELCQIIDNTLYLFKRKIDACISKATPIIVTDITNNKINRFDSVAEASKALNAPAPSLSYALKFKKLYYKRYKIEEIL